MKQDSSLKLNGEANPVVVGAPVSIALLGAAAFVVTADVRVINPLLHIMATEFKKDTDH